MIAGLVLAIGGLAACAAAIAVTPGDAPRAPRAYVAALSRAAQPTPTPTPPPQPYVGPIASIYLASAGLYGYTAFETGGTHVVNGRELFDNPSAAPYIMWYPNLQGYGPPAPGFPGGNIVMAAHVNYIGYGNGPFAALLSTRVGDTLSITMANGDSYSYTVNSVDLYDLAAIDMDAIVYPYLPSNRDRITLISCGGTFIPNPSGVGGSYESRVVVVADRSHD